MMVGMTRNRRTAAAAALAVAGGAAVMLGALAATPGVGWRGYVSEAGTAGQPYDVAYRSGLIVLAVGVALLGRALLPAKRLPGGWSDRLRDGTVTGTALLVAAALAGTSGAVPCTDRCPLPPYEPTTVADVVHAGASIAGMAVLAGAMTAIHWVEVRPATRRLASVAVAVLVPLCAAFGLGLLFVGRSTFGAVAERLILVVAVTWLVGTAALSSSGWPRGGISRQR